MIEDWFVLPNGPLGAIAHQAFQRYWCFIASRGCVPSNERGWKIHFRDGDLAKCDTASSIIDMQASCVDDAAVESGS